jgi:hypothetical protein
MLKCVLCGKETTDEEAKMIREKYPTMPGWLSIVLTNILEAEPRVTESKDEWENYHLEDGVEIICAACYNGMLEKVWSIFSKELKNEQADMVEEVERQKIVKEV